MELLVGSSFEKIKNYLENNHISAYRLINQTPSFPVSVDIYSDNAVIYLFDNVDVSILSKLESVLNRVTGTVDYFYKNKTKKNILLPLNRSKQIIINEYDHLFKINLSDYLDTGLFLDLRETRRWLAGLSRGKSVLNTFAYTGAFSLYAGKAGALRTFSVDISRVYCDWIQSNFELNNLSGANHRIVRMDTLEYLQYAKKKNLSFDIIIIDPPTFSRNKNKSFSVQRDHSALINNALEILTATGFILFSTNFLNFQMRIKKIAGLVLEKKDTVPPDFDQSTPHRCFIISRFV